MAQELFQAVQTAEDQADQLIAEAQRKARELLKNTQTSIAESERAMALEHRALYASILEEKRAAVNAVIAARRPAAEAARNESLSQSRVRLDQAAQRVFERVWNDGNR